MHSELANWDGSLSQRNFNHIGSAKASSSASGSASSSAGTTAPTTPAYIASTSPSGETSDTSVNAYPVYLDDKPEIDGIVGAGDDILVKTERLFVPNHLLFPLPAKEFTQRIPVDPILPIPKASSRVVLYSPQAVDEKEEDDDEKLVDCMLKNASPLPQTTHVSASFTRTNILNLPSNSRSSSRSRFYHQATTSQKPLFWHRSSSPISLFTPSPPPTIVREPLTCLSISSPRSSRKCLKRTVMAYVQVPPFPRGTKKADYYDGGQSEKRRLDALVRDAGLARQLLPLHPSFKTYGTSWKGKERAIDILDDSDDSDFVPSKSLKRKAKDLERDQPFSSLQPRKKKRGRRPKAVRTISSSVPSSSRQGTRSASVLPARNNSAGKNHQVIAKSISPSECSISSLQSISADLHRSNTPADNSNTLEMSPDISLSLSQAVPLHKLSPKNQREPKSEERAFAFENFDNVIWPNEEGPDADNVIQPFDEWPDTTLFQILSFGRHLREKKGLPPPTTYQQALEIATGSRSPRENSKRPITPSIDMGPTIYGTLTTGTHGGGMIFSARQHGSTHGSPRRKWKRGTWNSTASNYPLFRLSSAAGDDAETDRDTEGDIDMDYYINDFDVASGSTSHLPVPHAATLSVPKYAPREARSDVLPLPDTSIMPFPSNDMYMSDRQMDEPDIRPHQLDSTDSSDTNTFPPDLGDTVNDPFVSPYDYQDSPWMSVDGDASLHPSASIQNTWNGTIDPVLLGGGEVFERSPSLFRSIKRVPRQRRFDDMVAADDLSLSASESDYEDAEFKPSQEYRRVGPSNQWEQSSTSSSSKESLVISQPPPTLPVPTKKRQVEPKAKHKPRPGPNGLVWETGPLSACHQCRNKNTMAKMHCSQVKSNGVLCPLRYCIRCFVTRYDVPFDSTSETFVCFKCQNICSCTVCARKRGEVYVSTRDLPPFASSFAHQAKSSLPPQPAHAPIPQPKRTPTLPDNTTKHWGTIYSLSGEKIASDFISVDEGGEAPVVVPRKTRAAKLSIAPKPKKRIFIGAVATSWKFQNPVVKEISIAKKRKNDGNTIIREYIGKKPPRAPKASVISSALLGDENVDGPGSPGSTSFSHQSTLTPLSTPSPNWPAPDVGESAHFGFDIEGPAIGDGDDGGVTNGLHVPEEFNLSPNKMQSVIQAALSAAALT